MFNPYKFLYIVDLKLGPAGLIGAITGALGNTGNFFSSSSSISLRYLFVLYLFYFVVDTTPIGTIVSSFPLSIYSGTFNLGAVELGLSTNSFSPFLLLISGMVVIPI